MKACARLSEPSRLLRGAFPMAEDEGFEPPTDLHPLPDFESGSSCHHGHLPVLVAEEEGFEPPTAEARNRVQAGATHQCQFLRGPRVKSRTPVDVHRTSVVTGRNPGMVANLGNDPELASV